MRRLEPTTLAIVQAGLPQPFQLGKRAQFRIPFERQAVQLSEDILPLLAAANAGTLPRSAFVRTLHPTNPARLVALHAVVP